MKKLFNEFFYIPKYGKVREKVMLAHLASTITIVALCLVAMSIIAYAYFSSDVTSGTNIIRSATFKTEVQVQILDSNGKTVGTDINPITSNHQSFKIEGLAVGKTYTVRIVPIKNDTTAKTGFVIVTADKCSETYYTQQLGKDEKVEDGETTELSFKLVITDSTTVYLEAHWGTSSYYADFQNKAKELYITQDETITLRIDNGANKPNVKDDYTTEDTTETKEDPPETTAPPSSTTPPATQANPPATEATAPSTTVPDPPISTETSESTGPTEPTVTPETSAPVEQTEPEETTKPQATVEIQPTEEPTGATTTRASE